MKFNEILDIISFCLLGVLIVALTYGVSNSVNISEDARSICLSIIVLSAVLWIKNNKTIIKINQKETEYD